MHKKSLKVFAIVGAAFVGTLGACFLDVFGSASVHAQQDASSKTISVIVPFPPGGGTDGLARNFVPKFAEALGRTMIIENRPGAGGNIAAEYVKSAQPDGSILLFSGNNMAINAALNKHARFDPTKDFAPIGRVASASIALVVHPSLPVQSVGELIAHERKAPGTLNISTPGIGTPHHMAAEMFTGASRMKLTMVHYKGIGPMLTDMLSGRTQLTFMTLNAAQPLIASGKLRALAIPDPTRSKALPQVPTMAEAGFPNFTVNSWYGVLAPAGTPQSTVDAMHRAMVEAMKDKDLQEKLAKQGFESAITTPRELGDLLAAEVERYLALGRDTGLQIE